MIYDEEDKKALELQASSGHANLNLDPGIDFPNLIVCDLALHFFLSCCIYQPECMSTLITCFPSNIFSLKDLLLVTPHGGNPHYQRLI